MNVEGGTLSSGSGRAAISAEGTSSVSISNGSISSVRGSAIEAEETANITISGGSVSGGSNRDAVEKKDLTATVTVVGGSFSSDIADFTGEGTTVAKHTTTNGQSTYYAGTPENVANTLSSVVQSSDTVEITKGRY